MSDDLGQSLRRRRKELGLSREELELLTGVSVATISRCERGSPGVAVSVAQKITEALGCKLEIVDDETRHNQT